MWPVSNLVRPQCSQLSPSAVPNPRRDPTKPGVSGLSAVHLDALSAGHLTLDDLGRELGCSKQALSKAIKRRTAPKPAPPVASPDPKDGLSTVDFSTPEAIKGMLDGASLALLAALNRDMTRIASDKDALLGPTAAKAAAQAISTIRADLIASGVLPTAESSGTAPIMKLQVMTEDEEREVRDAAEAELGTDHGRASEDSPPGIAAHKSENGTPKTVSTAAPEAPPQSAPGLRPEVRAMLRRITDPEEFRAVLSDYGKASGTRGLRSIAAALGIETGRQDGHLLLLDRIIAAWPQAFPVLEKA